MTTRRNILILAGATALAGGCSQAAPRQAAVKAPDVVLADSGRGLFVLGGNRPGPLGAQAAAAADGRFVCAVTGSDLVTLDPADGVSTRSTQLGGGWIPRVVAGGGRACALSRTPPATLPAGRSTSPLLVTADGAQRTYDLPGVIEPDAFTSDVTGLFVLEWLPAAAPDHYRVRLLDLTTGVIGPLVTRDKTALPPGAEEQMRGEGRRGVLSPDGQLLYTLYTHQPGHQHTRDLLSGRPGNAHAFVHVLHLTEHGAYCLDLPHPFGEGPPAGHAIAAHGSELAVADATSGLLAYADTTALTITRTVPIPKSAAPASLAYLPDGRRVLAGAGRTVSVLDHDTGAVTARWSLPGDLRGLGVSGDGARVYCGGADEVSWREAGTGALLGRAAVDGLLDVRHVR
jgi:hypothetical protein